MSNLSKSLLDRFNTNLEPALFILVVASIIELVIYRLLGSMGFYVGVGTTGPRAIIADISIFTMLFTGALSAILLFWAMARIVNHPNIAGMWWRGILIFLSPLFLLSMFWSVWTPLSNWLLLAALLGVEFTVILICVLCIIRPVSFGVRRLFGVIAVVMLTATAKWLTLDFFQVNRLEKWGAFLLNAYEVAQFFMIMLPLGAFVLFIAGTREKLLLLLRRPQLSAIIPAALAAAFFLATVILIQRLTGEGDLLESGQYVMRVFFRTIGLKMGWTLAPLMAAVSIFFLVATTLMLLFGSPYRKRHPGDREIGLGLSLFYIAGLQPFTVYQLSTSLLGVLLMAMGVANRYPGAESAQTLKELQSELAD